MILISPFTIKSNSNYSKNSAPINKPSKRFYSTEISPENILKKINENKTKFLTELQELNPTLNPNFEVIYCCVSQALIEVFWDKGFKNLGAQINIITATYIFNLYLENVLIINPDMLNDEEGETK